VTLIDVHFHAIPPCYREAAVAAGKMPPVSGGLPTWSAELARDVMDRNGITCAILSISPGVHFGDDAAAGRLANECNEALAGCIAAYPGRFGAFAAVPLPDIDGALDAIAKGLDDFHLDGIGLFARYGDRYLGDPLFDPVMEVLNERNAIAFVHPASAPTLPGALPTFALEYPFETTRAAANLIFSRTVERFPNIRFILAHAGGALPFLATRLAACPAIDAARFGQFTADSIGAAIRQFWFDTALSYGPTTLAALPHATESTRILFGSDWPYAPESITAKSANAIQASEIRFKNALGLFPRLKSSLEPAAR
jgi:6-methylsalicylate decarboxylase